MKWQVNTGKGTVSAMLVVAIWSLSLTVNLPGLAVTPMLDSLKQIFGNVSEAEVQLLTVLPNVLIIPFVLLSGRLAESHHKVALIIAALLIYLTAGVLYLFTHTIGGLIWISCLLGVGCGIIIPFSTGLVAEVFVGKYRMRQMGIISAIGNLALVAATFIVGFLAAINWHLPFLVYLIPIVPLLLSPWLRQLRPGRKTTVITHVTTTPPAPKPALQPVPVNAKKMGDFYVVRTLGLIASYFLFMSVAAIVLNFLPFMMEGDHGQSSKAVGTVTSLLFVGMMSGGFLLTPTLRLFRGWTYVVTVAELLVGMMFLTWGGITVIQGLGAVIVGFALGTVQPIVYDKATEIVDNPSRSTLALAIIMAANYAAVALAPEITDFLQWVFRVKSDMFPFYVDIAIIIALLAVSLLRRHAFTFGISKHYY